jgi:hypothetical protein
VSDLLKLAEAYYTVARDLEWRASQMNEMGKRLFNMADQLCEQNAKETAMEPAPEPGAG